MSSTSKSLTWAGTLSTGEETEWFQVGEQKREASNESKECEVKEFRGIALKKEKE